jgi:hypothetical protein
MDRSCLRLLWNYNIWLNIFLVPLLLPTHRRCRGWLLYLIILNDTHAHTHTLNGSPLDEELTCRNGLLHKTQYLKETDRQTSVLLAEFETAIPASERQQTYAINRAATWIGLWLIRSTKNTARIFRVTITISCYYNYCLGITVFIAQEWLRYDPRNYLVWYTYVYYYYYYYY